jgi:hypothetical protein
MLNFHWLIPTDKVANLGDFPQIWRFFLGLLGIRGFLGEF